MFFNLFFTKREKCELLEQAARLVEQGWESSYWARDSNHKAVEPEDPSAVKFCVAGAVRRVAFDRIGHDYSLLWVKLNRAINSCAIKEGFRNAIHFNNAVAKNYWEVAELLRKSKDYV